MLTYSDAIDHLTDVLSGSDDEREQRKVRRAIQLAYQNLLQINSWNAYLREHRVRFEAPYSTGTIEYTHSSRALTLTGGTWPTWAAEGRVEIGGEIHEVDSRDSSSVLTLSSTNNPGDDVDSGTSYVLFQSTYLLPDDFVSMYRPVDSTNALWNAYIPPEQWFALERTTSATGKPFFWTILGDAGPNRYGRHAISLWPRPQSTNALDFLYRRRARRIRRTGFEAASYTGTVAGSAGTNPTLTFAGATLHASMVGCVIRLTDATDSPPDGDGSLKPFLEEFVITSVNTGAGTCVVSGTMANTYSGNKFRISDPIDIDPEMHEAFLRGCEWQLSILNREDMQTQRMHRELYFAAVRFAMECDARAPLNADLIYDASNPLEYGNYSFDF